jgi:hypothetical protein
VGCPASSRWVAAALLASVAACRNTVTDEHDVASPGGPPRIAEADRAGPASTTEPVAAASTAAAPDTAQAASGPAVSRSAQVSVRIEAPDGSEGQTSVLLALAGDVRERWTAGAQVSFDAVPRGRGRLIVRRRGFPEAVREVSVEPGEQKRIEVALDAGVVIEGRLVDPQGGPIPRSVVLAAPVGAERNSRGVPLWWSRPAETDDDGRFRIEGLASQAHELFAFGGPEPFVLDSARTSPRPIVEAPRDGVVLVSPAGCEVTLRLSLPAGTVPSGDVVVTQTHGLPSEPSLSTGARTMIAVAQAEWRAGETLRLTIAPSASWLRVSAPGFAPVFVRAPTVELGRTVDLGKVALTAGTIVRGRALDSDGHPIAGAAVSVVGAVAASGTVRTDADGRFALEDLGADPICIRVETEDRYGDALVSVPDSTGVVTICARRTALVSGRLIDEEGDPATTAEVWIWNGDVSRARSMDPSRVTVAKPDDRGWFRVRVAAGSCRAVVLNGRSSTPFFFRAAEGGTHAVLVPVVPCADD